MAVECEGVNKASSSVWRVKMHVHRSVTSDISTITRRRQSSYADGRRTAVVHTKVTDSDVQSADASTCRRRSA